MDANSALRRMPLQKSWVTRRLNRVRVQCVAPLVDQSGALLAVPLHGVPVLRHGRTGLDGGLIIDHEQLAGIGAGDTLATDGHIGNGLLLKNRAFFNSALR